MRTVAPAKPAESSHLQIEQDLRTSVLSGDLKPGARLPPSNVLARRWGVSCRAVQRAMAQLKTDGLIDRSRRRGTFVSHKQATTTIGLVFGPLLSNESSYFYRAILQSLRTELQTRRWSSRVYDGLSDVPDGNSSLREQTQEQLLRDLRHYGFAGLIVISPEPAWLREVQDWTDRPLAVWGLSAAHGDVQFDEYGAVRDCVEFLARRGRRRLAYLRSVWHKSTATTDLDALMDAARAAGLATPCIEQITLTGDLGSAEQEAFEKTLGLWRKPGDPAGPDALLVRDDVVMRNVAAALLKLGVTVPDNVLVACQTCREFVLHYGLPVARYEFSTRRLAQQLLEILWARCTAENLPVLPVKLRGQFGGG